jgi:energy-coupling factor transporter ATP-binding protein EcfA2/GNAT superfamily N-acetyltransferase
MLITVQSPIEETPRVQQVRGLFDLPAEKVSAVRWDVRLPLDEKPWHLGLIVGPSGCGKTTVARHLWPGAVVSLTPGGPQPFAWPERQSLLDAFPADLPVKEVIELLSSVGFSSPPAWLRPYHVLSTGQQFRAALARLLAEPPGAGPAVVDEYTSVVDRTAAQVGSAAVARAVRRRGRQLVAVTCHEDVEDWLQPDWVYRPAEGVFQWRWLRRRPGIALDVVRCQASAWPLFAHHHYLSGALHPGAVCFLASWRGRPVAFSAWLPQPGGRPCRREHRTVTLPDYQGVGLGNRLSAFVAALWTALGYEARSTTTHPAMIASRLRSPLWKMHRVPSMAPGRPGRARRWRHATTRLTAGFTYVGPPLLPPLARALMETSYGRHAAAVNAPAHSGSE